MGNKLYIGWAAKELDIVEGKYYAAYANRAFADTTQYIWPAGPFDTLMEADEEAYSHRCDDDTSNVILRKNNKWWRPENGNDIKFFPELPRIKDSGLTWVETV